MRDDLGLPAPSLVAMFGPNQQERGQAAYDPRKIERSTQHCHLFTIPSVRRLRRNSIPCVLSGQLFHEWSDKQDDHHYRSLAQAFEGDGGRWKCMRHGTNSEIDGCCAKPRPMRACD